MEFKKAMEFLLLYFFNIFFIYTSYRVGSDVTNLNFRWEIILKKKEADHLTDWQPTLFILIEVNASDVYQTRRTMSKSWCFYKQNYVLKIVLLRLLLAVVFYCQAITGFWFTASTTVPSAKGAVIESRSVDIFAIDIKQSVELKTL